MMDSRCRGTGKMWLLRLASLHGAVWILLRLLHSLPLHTCTKYKASASGELTNMPSAALAVGNGTDAFLRDCVDWSVT